MAQTAQLRTVVYSDIKQSRPGASIAISSDGKLIAGEYSHRLVIFDRATGRPTKELGDGFMPIWSPVGGRVAFYSTRSGALQLWVWQTGDADPRQITRFEEGINPDIQTRVSGYKVDAMPFTWSPDGTRIAFASRVTVRPVPRASGQPIVIDANAPASLAMAGIFKVVDPVTKVARIVDDQTLALRNRPAGEMYFSQLFIVEVHTADVKQITQARPVFYGPVWTSDGRSLIAVRVELAQGSDELFSNAKRSSAQIVKIGYPDGKVSVLVADAQFPRALTVSSDGTRLAYLATPDPYGLLSLRVLDLVGGKSPRELPSSTMNDRFQWSRGQLLARMGERRDKALFLVDPQSGQKQKLVGAEDFNSIGWDRGPKGELAWIADGKLTYLDRGASRPRVLFDFNPTKAEPINLGEVKTLTWRNGAGDELKAEYLLPPNYRPGERLPLIVDAYPLSRGGGWMRSALRGNQAWAAKGYVVFQPGPRSPHTWMNSPASTPFYLAAKGAAGWAPSVDDLMSGVDELIRLGIVDGDRMCLAGHSNGGGMASYVITQTNRFKCAVISAPAMADWVSLALQTPGGRETVKTFSGGFDFNENPEEFVRLSSVFQLHKVRTPTLIAVGDDDSEFLMPAIEIYYGIRDTGTEVTLLRYPNEGHVFKGSAMEDFVNRQMAFFNRFLSPVPPLRDVPTHVATPK